MNADFGEDREVIEKDRKMKICIFVVLIWKDANAFEGRIESAKRLSIIEAI